MIHYSTVSGNKKNKREQKKLSGVNKGKLTHQMNDSGSRQPDGDENGDELCQSDRTRRLEDVEILQNVRHRHEA